MKVFEAGDTIYEFRIVQKVRDSTSGSANTRKRVRVECSCGKRLTLPVYYLTRKSPPPKKDCGHGRKTIRTTSNQEYRIWIMMHKRCEDPRHVAYKHYGGRGIGVCDEWHKRRGIEGFAAFLNYIGPRPSLKYSIDRVDNDLGYQPFQPDGTTRQVRWATSKQQRANQRKPT